MYELPPALPGYENIKRYWDKQYNQYVAKILPGESYITRHNEIITTVVGSCVSACIRDKITGIGGMNHFMLPMQRDYDGHWAQTQVNSAARYGSYAMEHVINEILHYGGKRQNLEVKLFGGGRIMQQMANIGEQNINFVKDYVRLEKLNLVAEDLGDIHPRKIMFFPSKGLVRVKKLRSMEQSIIEREQAYQRDISDQSANTTGEVDFF